MTTADAQQAVRGRVTQIARWLADVYALDLDLDVGRYVMDPKQARRHASAQAPRTGVLVVEEEGFAWLALYIDARDRQNFGTLVEETSHLLCLAQHAQWDLPVSRVALELQAEVDRFVHAREHGRNPFGHFQHFHWRPGLAPEAADRYRTAHRRGERYCRRLARRFPRAADRPGLLRELRGFYRASPASKLGMADA